MQIEYSTVPCKLRFNAVAYSMRRDPTHSKSEKVKGMFERPPNKDKDVYILDVSGKKRKPLKNGTHIIENKDNREGEEERQENTEKQE